MITLKLVTYGEISVDCKYREGTPFWTMYRHTENKMAPLRKYLREKTMINLKHQDFIALISNRSFTGFQ